MFSSSSIGILKRKRNQGNYNRSTQSQLFFYIFFEMPTNIGKYLKSKSNFIEYVCTSDIQIEFSEKTRTVLIKCCNFIVLISVFSFFYTIFKLFFISTIISAGAIFVLSLLDEGKFKIVMSHIQGVSQNYISRDLHNSIIR